MTLLIFGKTGQVAKELAELVPDAIFLGRAEAEMSNPDVCAAAIRDHAPTAVINAAAYTSVDKAEGEESLATVINGTCPGRMAEACAALNIPFVHISTDYVFDGRGKDPFAPDHPAAPLGAYGRSKLVGEDKVIAAGGTYALLRTSWVFSAHGKNFLKTMLQLSETRNTLQIVADQVGGPTPADAIANACLTIIEALKEAPQKSGIYHFSGAPEVSWADFARTIFIAAGRSVKVNEVTTAEYPTPARRPLNSRMDCTATERVFGISRPDWTAATERIVNTLCSAGVAL
jgi:dTDP-4-dehydrorhamnose reductase